MWRSETSGNADNDVFLVGQLCQGALVLTLVFDYHVSFPFSFNQPRLVSVYFNPILAVVFHWRHNSFMGGFFLGMTCRRSFLAGSTRGVAITGSSVPPSPTPLVVAFGFFQGDLRRGDLPDILLSELRRSTALSMDESESNLGDFLTDDLVARGRPPDDIPGVFCCFLAVCFVLAMPCGSEHSLLVFNKYCSNSESVSSSLLISPNNS